MNLTREEWGLIHNALSCAASYQRESAKIFEKGGAEYSEDRERAIADSEAFTALREKIKDRI